MGTAAAPKSVGDTMGGDADGIFEVEARRLDAVPARFFEGLAGFISDVLDRFKPGLWRST